MLSFSVVHCTVRANSEHAFVFSCTVHCTVKTNSEHAFVFSWTVHCTVKANSEHAFVFSCSEMRFLPPVTFNPLILYLIV